MDEWSDGWIDRFSFVQPCLALLNNYKCFYVLSHAGKTVVLLFFDTQSAISQRKRRLLQSLLHKRKLISD